MSRDEDECPSVPSMEDFKAARTLVESFVPRAASSPTGMLSIATLTAGAMIARAIYQLEFALRRSR